MKKKKRTRRKEKKKGMSADIMDYKTLYVPRNRMNNLITGKESAIW